MGIVTLSSDEYCDTYDKLLSAADKALQRAKESGSNAVFTYSDLYKDKKEATRKISPYEEVNVLKRKISRLSERVDRVALESMYAFSKSMEARDYYTAEHAEEMVSLVLKIGKEIGLSKEMLNNLERGATLHDIGKIGISDSILRKKSKLTPEEYEIIKMHPKIGAEIIRAIHFLKEVVPVVLHHHERWDGKGYPSGLKAREIPLLARVVCIADVYQALISDRPYRKAYSKKEALEILKKEAGTHFDKDLVDILIRLESKPEERPSATKPRLR
jgi:putative nucleotidyltransferase with HDIG domain